MNVSVNHQPQKLNMTSSGFTLIELMVTIAVLAIIVGIAAPSISTQLANQRVKSTTATLANALKEAKAESIIRRKPITVKFSNNSSSAGAINLANIASYSYNAKSVIKATDTANQITFEPSRRANSIDFTICDSNASATPRQVTVSKLAVISNQAGGTC